MRLIDKINNKSAKVGIIGLGYVGLPLAVEFVNAGYTVIGIDVDEKKISSIIIRSGVCLDRICEPKAFWANMKKFNSLKG